MGLIADIAGKFIPMPNQAGQDKVAKTSREVKDRHNELWAKDTKKRKAREQQWQLNMAMVMGNQWVGWSGTAVQSLASPSWRIQNVDNKLFVRVRSKMTRLLAEMTPTCLPDSTESIDVRRAEYKERLLHHLRRETDDMRLRFRAAQWVVTCGEVYTEVFWNESSGDAYADNGGAFSEGDVGVRIWDPFAVWPGASSSAENNGGRIWTVDSVPVELARLKYADKDIYPDVGEGSELKLRTNFDNFFQGGGSRDYATGGAIMDECVMVKTLREYRTAALPEGRVSVIINGKVYDEKPLLWDGLTHILNYPSYSSYHGDAVEVRNSIQQQKSYNRLRSSWEEYVRTMAKGKILTHETTKIKSSQFDSEHMEIVKYSGSGPKPEPWMPPPMPSDTANLMQLCVAAMDDLFSDHLASQGKAPASASGSAINYLQEEDQRQHGPARDEWTHGWAKTYEKELDVVAGKSGKGGYTTDRTITILGENRRADVQRFDPDMIAGRNRVYISLGGALPENKVLRAEVVRRWFTDGALGDPTLKETRRLFMRLTDAGIMDNVYDDEALDEIRAEKENDLLKAGNAVAPRPEDDAEVHLRTHGHFMKSDEFLQLDPEIQNLFYDHAGVHGMTMMPPPIVDPNAPPGQVPPQMGPGHSPAAGNPVDMAKSVSQGAKEPPAAGVFPPNQPQ